MARPFTRLSNLLARLPSPRKLLRAAALAGLAAASAQVSGQAATEAITVQRGDTFSQIAARYTGNVSQWRKLFDPRRSNLENPDRIQVGQKLELVTETDGTRYLRAAGIAVAATPPVPKATAPVAATTAGTAPAAAVPTPTPATPAPAAAPAELVIGLLPNIPAATLTNQYESLKRYLERQGAFKVRFVIPPNFKAFFDGMMADEFDVAVGAPHMARAAQAERAMQPLGMYEPRIAALFVSPVERGAAAAADARGKPIGFANPQSLVAMYGQQWLRGFGMEPGRDYEVKPARTDLGVGRMMLTGEAAAAIMSNGEFRALPPDEGARMRIVESFARIPNFIWLAKPGLERARAERLRQEMRAFFADKDDGAAFARATGLSGFVDVDEATLRELDPFVAATRRAMGR